MKTGCENWFGFISANVQDPFYLETDKCNEKLCNVFFERTI